jgi:hypothetical protein
MSIGILFKLLIEGENGMDELDNVTQVRLADGLNVLVGLWLILAPALITFNSSAMVISSIATGLALIALAGGHELQLSKTWEGWLGMLVGLWAVIAPFAFAGTTLGAAWASVVGGVLAMAFGAVGLSAITSDSTLGHHI